jgi:Rieske Fe-S protein
MNIDRKQFLAMVASVVAGIRHADAGGEDAPAQGGLVVDAGPIENYATDGVYDAFRSHGFFVVRRGEKLFALSAVCTHRKCKISPERDRSFTCDCHGSAFDADGRVETGPAKRDLPVLQSFTNAAKHLVVKVSI